MATPVRCGSNSLQRGGQLLPALGAVRQSALQTQGVQMQGAQMQRAHVLHTSL